MNKLIRWAIRQGYQRGVEDGEKPWVFVGGAAVVLFVIRRWMQREDEVYWSGTVSPGEILTVYTESATPKSAKSESAKPE